MKNMTNPTSSKPASITAIEGLLGTTLYAAPQRGIDPLPSAFRALRDYTSKGAEEAWLPQYSLHPDGSVAALNLMYTRLTDAQWCEVAQHLDLSKIVALNLRGNQLRDNPLLGGLTNLQYLDLCENKIKELKFPEGTRVPDFIFLEGNEQMAMPPPEVVTKGRFAIRNFYEELRVQGDEVVYEAKLLILGDAGAGKTTLARKIENPDAPMPRKVEDSTDGIEVKSILLNQQQPPFTLHVWDFGGQEVYHATHQFFLTKRSLYILLCDGRKEEKFNYWLQIQELFGQDSSLLMVVNQNGNMQANLPMSELRRDFPNISKGEPTVINLETDKPGIIAFKNLIELTVRGLPQFVRGERVPKLWAAIRRRLEQEANDHISLDEFRRICKEEGIEDKGKQDYLLDFLHNLGAFLHFKDVAGLNKLVILKPEWATNAVYRVLDHTKEKGANGHFTRKELEEVWNCAEYESYFEELLLLMQRFELCYQTPERKDLFVVPSLLPDEPPKDYRWQEAEGLHTYYQYTFMPKGIMPRLIVRQHAYLEKNPVAWKRGAVFAKQNVRIEVVESMLYNRIVIKTNAANRVAKEFLRDLSRDIDQINEDFHFNERMTVEQIIPCNCDPCKTAEKPTQFKRSDLDDNERVGKDMFCNNFYGLIPVKQILDGIFPDEQERMGKSALKIPAVQGIPRAFISYSKHDKELLEEFKRQLNPLVLAKKLTYWEDSQILPGEEWDPAIQTALREAEVIFLLVSADFLSTKYILENELQVAMERHRKKEAIVIPIQLNPVTWDLMPFGKLQGLPRKGVWIADVEKRASVWLEVVNEVRALLVEHFSP
jgi:internalin A